MQKRRARIFFVVTFCVAVSLLALTGCRADMLNRQVLSQVKGTYLNRIINVAFTIDKDGNVYRVSQAGGVDRFKMRFDDLYAYYEDSENEKVEYLFVSKCFIELDGVDFNYVSDKAIIPYSRGAPVGTWTDNALFSPGKYELYADGTGFYTEGSSSPLACTWRSHGGELVITARTSSGNTLTKNLWYVRYGDECYLDPYYNEVGP